VVVELSENGERVVLEVRDQGIGINPADQSRIFERFERAVSRRRFGGFGLGLWITRKVVEAHGGTIHLVSAPGLGSTFRVELPK
jgi:signal transduction histidine kinase